jgi:hypothetical protein
LEIREFARWCRACKGAGGNLIEDPLSLDGEEKADMRRLTAAVAMVVLWAGPALAQEAGQTKVKIIQEEDRTIYKKKTVIDFTDVAVEGELTRPEGSYVLNRKHKDFQSLIRVRDNFVPELQKSVDNL